MTDKILEIRDLWKAYPGDTAPVPVLRGVSLDLHRAETVALTGESGSGKSTLLHIAAGLDLPDRGKVLLQGTDIGTASDPERARLRRTKAGIVFQQFNLIPSLRVADNIAFQARLGAGHDPAWCAHLTERLGLAEHVKKYPETLSGGQQQRVAVGRALAARPPLILADEPTGNLDEATGDAVLGLMLDLVREAGSALLLVTHSERIAQRLGRRLHLRQGQFASISAA